MTTVPEAPAPPLPLPDPVTQFFWDGVARHELWIQRGRNCGHYLHYPMVLCRYCHSDDLAGEQVSGRATLYTYSVVHVNDLPPFNERVPYVAAIVELEEGPRLMTNIEGVPFDELGPGMPVTVEYKAISDDVTIPVFRRAG